MNRKFFILFLALTFILCMIAPYTEAADLKIGYVNRAYIFDNYNKTIEQDKTLEKQAKQKKEERRRLVNQIKKMKDESDLMSEKAKENKRSQIDERLRQLQEYDQQARLGLGQERDKMVRSILKEIQGVIDSYASKNGYDMILNDKALLYSQEQFNITKEILGILNSKR